MLPYANAIFPHTEDAIDCSMHHYILLPLRKKNKKTANRNVICDQFTNKLCFLCVLKYERNLQLRVNIIELTVFDNL